MIILVIEELIKERGLKKKYISKQLGITQDTLTNWMNGRSMPKLDQAVKLAEILNCKLEDIFKEEKEG